MVQNLIQRCRAAMLPSAIITPLLVLLWIWARYFYVSSEAWPHVAAGAFLGWLAVMFLAATVAGISWAVVVKPSTSGERESVESRVILGIALLVDGCGILLFCIAPAAGIITCADVIRIYLLLVAWIGFWTTLAWALRRFGAGLAVAICLSLAMTLFAGPVTAVPLARNAVSGPGGTQDAVVRAIGYSTPLLGMLDAIKSSLRIGWAQLPQMYHLSGLGQDIPMTLPPWWANTLIYSAAALIIWAYAILTARYRPPNRSAV